MKKIVFRCDFGPNYGLGHLMRCLSLAQGFQDFGFETLCLTNEYGPELQGLLDDSGLKTTTFQNKSLGLNFDLKEFVEETDKCLTIFDNYDVTFEQMVAYRSKYNKLIAIDDLADRRFDVDMIINQNFGAENLKYDPTSNSRLLLGTDYVMLRRNITNCHYQPKKRRIFLSFGGGNVIDRIRNLLYALLEIDAQVTNSVEIDFIFPAQQNQIDEVRKLLAGLNKIKINFVANSFDLSTVMQAADFAITAAGSTVYELASIGVPQIAFVIDDNQILNGKAIETMGIGKCLGRIEDSPNRLFVDQFLSFLEDFDSKRDMSIKGKECIDGKGVRRIVKSVIEYYNSSDSNTC